MSSYAIPNIPISDGLPEVVDIASPYAIDRTAGFLGHVISNAFRINYDVIVVTSYAADGDAIGVYSPQIGD